MKALLTSLMALTVFVAVEAFLFLGGAFAQGDAPDGDYCVKGTSYVCVETHDCLNTFGCSVVNFTVPCHTIYYLTAQVVCPDPYDCKYCQACANLYLETQFLGNGHSPCQPDVCEQQGGPTEVELKPDRTYTLYVCKIPCGAECSQCPSDCRAVAYVYYPGSSCPSP